MTLQDTRAETLAAILNSEDLSIGIRMSSYAPRLIIRGAGREADMSPSGASKVLRAMEIEWGEKDPQCIIMRGMIDAAMKQGLPA